MPDSDTLIERWRKPPKILAVEETDDLKSTVVGRVRIWRRGVNFTVDQDTFQRIREGRVCLDCIEPQETAFPEVCSLPGCGYRIRENQARDLLTEFEGEKHIGPSTTLMEEQDRLDDYHAERMWRKHGAKGILIPRGVKLNGS